MPLEIFKSGTFTDMSGKELTFTDEDIANTKAAYSPAVFRAPLVVGHPTTNGPAYGWVSTLDISNGKLLADSEQVEPQFAELVNAGRYPKISASFFHPQSKNNPVPGVWYLRHVGFLGAAAPAVKGLKTAAFSDDVDGVHTVEFGQQDSNQFSEPEQAMTMQNTPEAEAARKKAEKEKADFAEQQANFAQQQQELAEREKALQEKEARVKRDEIASFCDKLVDAGKLLPGHKDNMVAFIESISNVDAVSFADGESGNAVEKTPDAFFREFLDGLPKVIDFSEHSAEEDETDGVEPSFAAPAGYTVNTDRLELHNKALRYQAKNNCDYSAAIAAVTAS